MAGRHAIVRPRAFRTVASAGNADLGRRTSRRPFQGRPMLLVSRQTNQRQVGALGNGDFMHGVSCSENARRYDDAEPRDAEGTDLLCLPREIRRFEAAHPSGEGSMH